MSACSNPRCRLGYAHDGPCDTRTDDQVALALPAELQPAQMALARAFIFASNATTSNATANQMAEAMVWDLHNDGWSISPLDGGNE